MTAESQDFTVYEGEDKTIEISVLTESGGSPVNLGTPTSVVWNVKYSSSSTEDALITKTYADAEITVTDGDATNDKLQIDLVAADTQGMEGKAYYHEARVVDGDADNHVISSGTITVKHSSTG